MVERHYDYILTIPSIPAGGNVIGTPLVLEPDAPFFCRGIGLRITPPVASRQQTNVQLTRFNWTNRTGTYLADQAIPAIQFFAGAYGQGGRFRPVRPQQVFPPAGVVRFDLYNDSGQDLTNVQFMLRGVKLYPDGIVGNPTYPTRVVRTLDFTYQSGKGTPDDPQIVLATTQTLRHLRLQINGDADFVLRGGLLGLSTSSGGIQLPDGGGSAGPYSTTGYTELYAQIFDDRQMPYSNAPIHVDWLFGGNLGDMTVNYTPGLSGPAAPGLFVPEIYLQRNHALYFDLIRNDAAYTGVVDDLPVPISIAWYGSKVYA